MTSIAESQQFPCSQVIQIFNNQLSITYKHSFQSLRNSRGVSSRVLSGTYLEDVNKDPLTEPKQDKPTKTGMIQDMTPR